MALPVSGKISLGDVNVELALGRTAPVKLGNGVVRTLAGRPSGKVSMSDLRGKSNALPPNAVAFQLTSAVMNGGNDETIGYSSLGSPTSGALSPNTYLGYTVWGVYIWYSGNSGAYNLVVGFTSANAAPGNGIKAVTIGGITFNGGIVNTPGTDKLLLANIMIAISAAQFNAIKAAILNRTTTLYIHY